MSWKFDKVPAGQLTPWDENPPEGMEWACKLVRRMPDGQTYRSIFFIGEDRQAAAMVIRSEKVSVRRITDAEWKPTTTNPSTRPGSEGKRDA